jgi:undecaprenyl-diphosphatase
MELILSLDEKLFLFLNNALANPFFDKFFPFITEVDHWMLVYIIALSMLLWKGGKKGRLTVLALILTVIITDQFVSSFLKDIIGRLRPCHTLEEVRLLVNCGSGKSFPSAHAANNFAAAFVITRFYKNNKWIFFTIATLMAFSRVYIGVHYPLDILGGAFIGSSIGILVSFGINKILNKEKHNVKRQSELEKD